MKTKSMLIVIAGVSMILIACHSMAQRISFGAKAGMNIAYFSNVVKEENGTRFPHLGFAGGFVSDFSLSGKFSIQAELLYSERGMNIKFKEGVSEMESRIEMNAIQLPVLVKFSIPAGKCRFYLNTGISPSVAFSGKSKYTEKYAEGNEITDTHNLEFGKNKWQQFDLLIPVGGGFGVQIGSGFLFLDLRYNIGLVDVVNTKDRPDGYIAHFNRNCEITIGYLISLGRK
jgi:hypothetical protein